MSKYIDAEKLTTIIEERKAQQDQWINRYRDPINQGISHELTEILSIVDSLQQEQPSNLKEAAEHSEIISYPMPEDGDIEKIMEVQKARIFHEIGFKAGAEWMAGQAKKVGGVVHHTLNAHWIVTDQEQLTAVLKEFPEGAEVEILILARKEG